MNLTILCDVDGVVADLCTTWLGRYNADYDDHLSPNDITAWNTHDFVKRSCGMKIYDYLWDESLYDNVQEIPGAFDGIKMLRAAGHRVVFVTSGIQPAKVRWLHERGFLTAQTWQQERDIVIAHDKSLIKGDVLIDDGPHNFQGFNGIKVLFNQPWNHEPYRAVRVRNWKHIVKLFM